MSNWQRLYDERKWDELWDWMRDDVLHEDRFAFFEQLRRDIRPIIRENGTERVEELPQPDEVALESQGAAGILQGGYLEWLIRKETAPDPNDDGIDTNASEAWDAEVERVGGVLNELRNTEEPTKGAVSLSRNAHIQSFEDAIRGLKSVSSKGMYEMASHGADQEDVDWLRELIAEVASQAFQAGIHARAASGKIMEAHAVRGQKTINAAKQGGNSSKATKAAMVSDVIETMSIYVAAGHSVSRAADLAAKNNVGASAGANRKLWYTHSNKK